MENISYSQLVEEYGAEDVEGVTDLITDILTSAQPIVRIGKEDLPLSVVQSRFRKLDETHMVFQLHFLIPLLLSLYHIGVPGDSLSTRPTWDTLAGTVQIILHLCLIELPDGSGRVVKAC